MTEQGIVRKIEGQLVWIAAQACAGCGREGHCSSCDSHEEDAGGAFNHHDLRLFGTRSERLFAVRNSASLSLKQGDRVEYFISPGKAVKAGFLILIVPVLAFFLLYGLTGLLFRGAGETPKVLAGVAGILLGFGTNVLLRRGSREYPEITRVLS